jgi:signal transduction histidine kinase
VGFEIAARRKDGTEFHAEVSLSPVRTDEGIAALVVVRDATERSRSARALRASAERYRTLYDEMPATYLTLDEDSRIVSVNRFGAEHLGYHRGELSGRSVDDILHRDDRDALHMHLREEARAIRRDDGRNVVLVVAEDITKIKEAEAEIQRLNEALHRRVEDLDALASQLKETKRRLEMFNGAVAHDLRAPLRVLRAMGEALREDFAGKPLDAAADALLREMNEAAAHMGMLIDDLLLLAEAEARELPRELVDLSALARAVIADLRRRDPLRDVHTTVPDGMVAHGAPGLLRIVLDNLLGNAWKYTAGRSDARIEFGEETSADGEHRFFVRDNGVGFDMAAARRIFEPFHRLHADHEFKGTGVGLATVKSIVERHGGRVWAHAEKGRGATFYFTLGAGAVREGPSRDARSRDASSREGPSEDRPSHEFAGALAQARESLILQEPRGGAARGDGEDGEGRR